MKLENILTSPTFENSKNNSNERTVRVKTLRHRLSQTMQIDLRLGARNILRQSVAYLLILLFLLQPSSAVIAADRGLANPQPAAGAPASETAPGYLQQGYNWLFGENPAPSVEAPLPPPPPPPPTISEAAISRHHPSLNGGTIDGSLRVFSGESYAINSQFHLNGDLYAVGTPTITVNSGASHGGVINDGGSATPSGYGITLNSGVVLPGKIHTRANAIALPSDIPTSVPNPSGTRTVNINSPADLSSIGNWATLRNLNVNPSNLVINVPPGNYGTFSLNGPNIRLVFSAGTYNFSGTVNLNSGSNIQANGATTINIGQNLNLNNGVFGLGAGTASSDVKLNIVGSSLSVNNNSQVSALVRAANATVNLNAAIIRGHVIADYLNINSGQIIGDANPADTTAPTLAITSPANNSTTTSATVNVTGTVSDGGSGITSVTVNDAAASYNAGAGTWSFANLALALGTNVITVKATDGAGNITTQTVTVTRQLPPDVTAPSVAITSPANNTTVADATITVSGTASDTGLGATGINRVMVNGVQAAYNSGTGTWTISGVQLNEGANTITATAFDNAPTPNSNQISITVTRFTPDTAPPAVAITSPANNATVPDATVTVSGTVSDTGLNASGVNRVMVNGVQASYDSGTGTWTISSVGLNEGANTITAVAYDNAPTPNSSQTSITVTRTTPDTQAPTVSVTSPADGSETYDSAVSITGTADDTGLNAAGVASVTVNGQNAAYDANTHQWTISGIALAIGDNTITVIAIDGASPANQAQAVIHIIRKEIPPPTISITSPADNSTTTAENIPVSGSAAAFSTGDNHITQVTVNDIPASFDPGTGTWTLASLPLTLGPNVITAKATDSGGRETTAQITVVRAPVNQGPVAVDDVYRINEADPEFNIKLPFTFSAASYLSGSPFNSIIGMVASENGKLYVSDSSGAIIAVDLATGTTTTVTTLPYARPRNMVIGDASFGGSLIVSDHNSTPFSNCCTGQVLKIDTGSGQVTVLSDGNPTYPGFADPFGLATSSGGNFPAGAYVMDFEGSSPHPPNLFRIAGDGTRSPFLTNPGIWTTERTPAYLIFAPGGDFGNDLFVADGLGIPNPAIWRVNAQGVITSFISGEPLRAPGIMRFGRGGIFGTDLYVLDNQLKSIFRITPAGTISVFARDLPLTEGLTSMEFAPDGQSLFVGAGSKLIRITSPASLSVAAPGVLANDTDNENDPLTAALVSGPSQGTVTLNPNGSFDYSAGAGFTGTDTFTYQASDGTQNSNTATVTISNTVNQAPVINAGPDQTISLPSMASLNGVVTDDGLPSGTLVTNWSQVSGPAAVSFGVTSQAVTQAAFSAAGTYVLRLTANDGELSIADDITIVVTPQNNAPTVSAGADQTVTLPATINLDGSASDDGPPQALSVSWTKVSGDGDVTFANPGSTDTTACFTASGVYVLRLTATDGQLTVSDDVTVTIRTLHTQEIKTGNGEIGQTEPNLQFSRDGGVTWQPAFIIEKYDSSVYFPGTNNRWGQIPGTKWVNFVNSHWTAGVGNTFGGTYTAKYRTTFNLPADYSEPSIKGLIEVDNEATVYLNGVQIAFHNVFVDPPASFFNNNPALFHAGENVIEIDWVDVGGGIGGLDYRMLVSSVGSGSQSNQAPIVSAREDQIIYPPSVTTLNGVVRDDYLPSCGSGLSISWTKVSGPGSAVFANPNSAATTVSFSALGTYVLRLTGSDGVSTVSDDVTIIASAVNTPPQVSAGQDREVRLPDSITLTGTATDDGIPPPAHLSSTWSKVSGPGSVTFTTPNSLQTTASFGESGTYVLRLTASDSALSSSDETTVTVYPETAACASDDFIDDFNDNQFDTQKWSIANPASPMVVSEQNQRLRITLAPNTAQYNSVSSNQAFNLTNRSFSVEVADPGSQAGWVSTFVLLELDANNYYIMSAGAGSSVFEVISGGVSTQRLVTSYNYQPFWRMRHDSVTNQVRFESSTNGQTWTLQHAVTPTIALNSLRIRMGTGAYGTGNSSPGQAVFDNVRLVSVHPNCLPTVAIASPAENAEFPAGITAVPIEAAAADSDGSVSKVEFFSDGVKIGETTASPYVFNWGGAPAGQHTLTAKVTDDRGASTISAPVHITVLPPALCYQSDDFNDNAIDLAKWVAPPADGQVYERNQRLEVIPFSQPYRGPDGSIRYNGYLAAAECDYSGFATSVEIVQATPFDYGVETDFRWNVGIPNYSSINVIGMVYSGPNLGFYYYVNGVRNITTITPDPVAQRFWRIRHVSSSDEIVWETSPDNISWTIQRSAPRPFPLTSIRPMMSSGTYTNFGNPGTAIFDNFVVSHEGGNHAPTVNAGIDQTTSVETGDKPAIYTMNSDGTNVTRLTYSSGEEQTGQWSPDGTKILFFSKRNGANDIYSMNPDGSGQTRLTYDPADDISPYWAPDGTRIYFASARTGNFDIYSMNPDGSNVVQLTNNSDIEYRPNPRPQAPGVNGDKIAFFRYQPGNTATGEIWTMNLDGSNQQKLTNNSVTDDVPVWSPDGSRMAFVSVRDGNIESYIMNADGTNVQRISNHPAEDWVNDWSLDGASITYTSNRTGDYEVYTYRVADGVLSRLTYNPAIDYAIFWSPAADKIVFASNRQGVYLQGTAIDDGNPAGSSVSVNWTKQSGPGTVTFSTPNSAGTNARFSQAGTYVLRLTATDGQASGFDEVTVVVQPLPNNQAPTVNAGLDKTANIGSSVGLHGLVGDDGLPIMSTVSQLWTKTSGPGSVTFNSPNSTATNAAFSSPGTYVLRLTATDSLLTSFDEVTITVLPPNQAPQVNAGADQAIILPAPADLSGTVNDDGSPAGSTIAVTWSKTSGPGTVTFSNPGSTATTASFSVSGEYVLRLSATDSELAAFDEITVTVLPNNQCYANDDFNDNLTDPNKWLVPVPGSQVYERNQRLEIVPFSPPARRPDGAIFYHGYDAPVTCDYTGVTSSVEVVQSTPLEYGVETVFGWVPYGGIDPAANFIGIAIGGPNLAFYYYKDGIRTITIISPDPVAHRFWRIRHLPATDEIVWETSSDNVAWNIQRRSPSPFAVTDIKVSLRAGTYLTLPETGMAIYDNFTITRDNVGTPSNEGPVVNAGQDTTVGLAQAAVLNGTVTDDGLPTGSAVTSIWTKVSGSGNVAFADRHAAVTTATFSAPGTYVLRLSATDSQLSRSDDVTVTVSAAGNSAPQVSAGADQNVSVDGTATLNGTATDDGLPAGSTLSVTWSKVSGNGNVIFSAPNATSTNTTFSAPGVYVLRLTASDSVLSAFDDVTVTVSAVNQSPQVSAGADQSVSLPNSATLNGTATDDGLPAGGSLTVSWSKVSGAGDVIFSAPNAPVTNANFSAAGTYVLRLTANDGELTVSDDVTITVNAGPVNQSPTSDAGPDQIVTLNANLLRNPGAESELAGGELPNWTEVHGSSWTRVSESAGGPPARFGRYTLNAGSETQAELRQDVDLRAFSQGINDGTLQFTWKAFIRSLPEAAPDGGTVIVEYRDALNQNTIASLNSGEITTTGVWHETEDTRVPPPGTGFMRIRLIAQRHTGATSDVFFDGLSLRAEGPIAAVLLDGTTSDDGLPAGSSLQSSWTRVSGPGAVSFADPSSADSPASFTVAGTYVLRLTASDGVLSASDDVTVTVNPANTAPVVSAGADQTITLPNSAQLNGSVTGDGEPQGGVITTRWSKVSGPGAVTFSDASIQNPTASFTAAGTYVLRLFAEDGELEAMDEVTITVNAQNNPVNQPPTVEAGNNQTIQLPVNSVTLNGTVTDDGLPNNGLSIAWTKTSGPGNVSFANPNAAQTSATFDAAGSYLLRLTASDGQYTSFDEVAIVVNAAGPQNQPPSVTISPDQTITLSQQAILEALTLTDDGLPTGAVYTYQWTKVSGPGTVTFTNPTETATYATFSEIGVYVVRLTASDSELTGSHDATVTVTEDVPAPSVEILTPDDGISITEPTAITGTVTAGNWRLEYSLTDTDNLNNRSWTTAASGAGAASGTLGTLDTTLMLNGTYDVRLISDNNGQISSDIISVTVENNLKIGHFTVSFEDMNVPVAGIPIQIVRTYDSRDKRKGDFGYGWTMGVKNMRIEKNNVLGLKWYQTRSSTFIPTYCVEPTRPHIVSVTMPSGKVEKFEAGLADRCQNAAPITNGNLVFTPQGGARGKLEVIGSNEVAVAGSVPGPVDLIGFDSSGIYDRTSYKYTAKDGTEFIIDQLGGLQSVKDTNNNTLTISASGITHSSGTSISFTRDASGRITHVTDPAGKSNVYTYDAAGDLVSFKDRENNTTSFTYEPTIPHHLKSIVDPLGRNAVRNEYDASGRLLRKIDTNGEEIIYTHDLTARAETVRDRLGNETRFEYDARGNVLKQRDALNHETTFSYDVNDNMLTETNALGKTTTYTYDAQDNKTSVTDPLGNRTEFTYNLQGKVLTTKDARNNTTTKTYDTAGNLLTTTDANGGVTTNIYNPFSGKLVTKRDALNNPTTFTYVGNYVTKQTDAQGNETTFGYDANGNRNSQTVKRTNALGQIESITTSSEFDDVNRLVKTIFADGTFTRTEYDELGMEKATVDQAGRRTEYEYDALGRLSKTTYPDGKFEESTYDEEGRRLTGKDRAGRVTNYQYDALGRLKKTTLPDGTFTQTVYDAAGQILSSTDAAGNVTTYVYDDGGRRTQVRNALNQITEFTYDAVGNQVTVKDALNHITTSVYDDLNRREKTIFADGTFTQTTFDALGRSTAERDQAGKIKQFFYDSLGRMTKVRDALNQETRYEYNELGQQIKQIDALNRETRYEFDKLGRRTKRILPLGQVETYAYEASGNLESRTDFNGKTTTFAYDSMRRLLSKTPDASLSQPTVSYTYNDLGQRATMTDASGTTNYAYNTRNRLASKQTPFGTLSYTYAETGNIETVRSSNPNGVSMDYDYDELNRLETVRDNRLSGNQDTTYTYDAVGNLQSYTYPNQVTTNYAFNNLNRLTSMTLSNTAGGLAGYSYTLGAAGNRTQVVENGGRTVNYVYDDLYRLTQETIAGSAVGGSVNYGYDAVGNRLTRNSNITGLASQSQSYDGNDRLNSDTYDANGNTSASNGNNYTYNFENRLTSTGSVQIVYDGDGNRVSKIVNGVRTDYLVDTNNLTGYAQVVEELQNSQVIKAYTYGIDLISQRHVANGNAVSFYNYDGHGSVRQLTDLTGSITDTYSYDAFGNILERTGTTDNSYLFTGEQFDADLGFYYSRARYLDVRTGRFISFDSYEGNKFEPRTLHKYLYVGNDPVNNIDPSGFYSIAETMVVMDINGILNTMSNILAAAAVIAVACAVEAGVTATLNALEADVDPLTPCGVKGPKDYVRFAHGTSMLAAVAIQTTGVLFEAIMEQGNNSWYPGAFFTVRLDPNPVSAIEIAMSFGLRRSAPHAVLVGKMPRNRFNALVASGAIIEGPIPGEVIKETVFLPTAFPALDFYNKGKWDIIPY